MRSIIPFVQIIAILLIVLMNKAPLAIVMLRWIISQGIEDLSITLRIRKGWTLVHHLQGVKQPEHHAHLMLAHWAGSRESNASIRAFDVGQCKNLRLGALLEDLANYWEIHIISIGHNMVPREVVLLYFRLNLLFDFDGKVLLQEMMNNKVGVFVLGSNLDWQHSSLFINERRKFGSMVEQTKHRSVICPMLKRQVEIAVSISIPQPARLWILHHEIVHHTRTACALDCNT
mmetsp:Transcript_23970/g.50840  ORF Transcript_23970/g.50840 Transcript_23970/m.50840 type:complete len:231 (-) Transcript_23970:1438-2130(-)